MVASRPEQRADEKQRDDEVSEGEPVGAVGDPGVIGVGVGQAPVDGVEPAPQAVLGVVGGVPRSPLSHFVSASSGNAVTPLSTKPTIVTAISARKVRRDGGGGGGVGTL